MPTIDQRVAASADDASQSAAGGVSVAATIFNVDATGEWGAARFQVAIPVGATITAAWLSLRLDSATEDEPDVRFYGEKTANAAVYTTASNSISNRTRTTASVPWSSTNLGGAAATYNTPSLVSIIQELVDTYDYSSGTNYMAIMWTSENNINTRDLTVTFYDGNASTAPLLHIEYTGGSTYVLTAATGAIALTHTAASLLHNYRAVADPNTYSLTGIAASLTKGYALSSQSASYVLTGQIVGLRHSYLVVADPRAYTLTGQSASLARGLIMVAAAGTYNLTGFAAELIYTPNPTGYVLAAESGDFTLSGQAVNFRRTYKLVLVEGALILVGQDVSLEFGRTLLADTSAYLLTGQDVDLIYTPAATGYVLVAESGTFQLQGQAALLLGGYRLLLAESTFVLLGADALLWWSGIPIPDTPSERIRRIEAEMRVYGILGDSRTLIIAFENRVDKVPHENRGQKIEKEARILVLAQ